MMNYFRIVFDHTLPEYKHFDCPVDSSGKRVSGWKFSGYGPWLGGTPLRITASGSPSAHDFNMGLGDLPVVIGKIVTMFANDDALSEAVQFVPVIHDGRTFYILNVLPVVDCVDESLSRVTKWTEEDERPDMLGQYSQVVNLHVDPKRLAGIDICRIKGWEVAMIVSERVAEMFRKANVTGVILKPVT
jgi:hypothetical protein